MSLLILATSVSADSLISPEVLLDHLVTFRIKAPNAKEVAVRIEGKPLAMQEDEQGVWSVTSDPFEPDIYAYSFSVDGLRVPDPNNPLLKYNLLGTESQVHVPDPTTLPWEINDVAHGVIHRHHFKSGIVGDDRDFVVYTPPGYNPAAKRLTQCSISCTVTAMPGTHGPVCHANVILDNLVASRQAKPMVVVMPYGYRNKELLALGWVRVRSPESN